MTAHQRRSRAHKWSEAQRANYRATIHARHEKYRNSITPPKTEQTQPDFSERAFEAVMDSIWNGLSFKDKLDAILHHIEWE